MDAATIQILNLAKWWDTDPDIVEQWSMPDFADREEYMNIQMEKSNPTPADQLQPGEIPYERPKR